MDLNTIQTKFLRYDSQWNDSQVAQFVHTYIQSLTNVRKKTSHNLRNKLVNPSNVGVIKK